MVDTLGEGWSYHQDLSFHVVSSYDSTVIKQMRSVHRAMKRMCHETRV